MTDWDKELRKRRAALDRAERAVEEGAAGAHADGHPYRWIGERVKMNHETVRKTVARVNAHRWTAPQAGWYRFVTGQEPEYLGTDRPEPDPVSGDVQYIDAADLATEPAAPARLDPEEQP